MFAKFVAAVNRISGVDPQIAMVGKSGESLTPAERMWRGGCYANAYNYATAEVLWQHLTVEQAADAASTAAWVKANWKGLPIRKERKAVNAPLRFAASLTSFAQWQLSKDVPQLTYASYKQGYDDFTAVKYMGSYISMRFLEYMHRYVTPTLPSLPDFRPLTKYPRQPMALMVPTYRDALLGNNSQANLDICHECATALIEWLQRKQVEIDYCSLQALLCEYRQAIVGGHHYAVQALDSEMSYYAKVAAYWGDAYTSRSQFYAVRKQFNPLALGEIQGWDYERKRILGVIMRDFGYVWNDIDFSYNDTTDFAHPVRRAA
jgi:hypothetical protein